MITSPPRPPSPPSGPPMGTNFSRRKDDAPDPPVPAFTRTMTRSMNIGRPLHPDPEHPVPRGNVRRDHRRDRVEHAADGVNPGAGVQGAVEVRVQLPLLP